MENRFYNSFDTVEKYRFSFGQYKGKSIDEIKDNDDAIEFLKRYRKKIKKEVRNPKVKKYFAYNKRGLEEIEDYLLEIGENIEKTILDEQIAKDINEEVIEKEVINTDYSRNSFKELLILLEEKIVEQYDEKFQSKKYVRKEYKDYLCLRYGNLTYLETLENQSKEVLIKILNNI